MLFATTAEAACHISGALPWSYVSNATVPVGMSKSNLNRTSSVVIVT